MFSEDLWCHRIELTHQRFELTLVMSAVSCFFLNFCTKISWVNLREMLLRHIAYRSLGVMT